MARPKSFWSFWTTLPGILTGTAAVLTAIGGLIVILRSGNGPEQGTDETGTVAWREETLSQPSAFGKAVSGSSGSLSIFDNSPGKFSGKIRLIGLAPNHRYVLTINGKPGHSGNRSLPESHGAEGYLDFAQVTTNETGDVVDFAFDAPLPVGYYDVKFFVKDTDDWKIVLFSDFLHFTVN